MIALMSEALHVHPIMFFLLLMFAIAMSGVCLCEFAGAIGKLSAAIARRSGPPIAGLILVLLLGGSARAQCTHEGPGCIALTDDSQRWVLWWLSSEPPVPASHQAHDFTGAVEGTIMYVLTDETERRGPDGRAVPVRGSHTGQRLMPIYVTKHSRYLYSYTPVGSPPRGEWWNLLSSDLGHVCGAPAMPHTVRGESDAAQIRRFHAAEAGARARCMAAGFAGADRILYVPWGETEAEMWPVLCSDYGPGGKRYEWH